jgi:hypothetical protein
MTIFRVVSSTPLPEAARIDAVHFESELTAASVSDAVPGGHGGLSLGYSPFMQGQVTGRLGNPIDFVDLGHIQVFAGDERGFCVFEGRVQDIDSPTGLQATAVTATGYGVGEMAATTDMWYFQDPYDGEPSIGGGQLLREVLQAAAPLLKVGDKDAFYEPGGAYLRSGESGRYPNQTVDEIVKAGDTNNNQVLFAVYEDRVVQMLPRVPPVDPVTGEVIADYYVPVDRKHVTWRRSGTLMVGAVAVQFKDPNSGVADHTELSSAQEMQNFRDAHGGLLRGFLVPSSSWTQAQAEFYRDSYLSKHKVATLTCMVNADPTWPVYDAMGGAIPGYMVRSGGWLKVGDQDPLMVTSTRKDLKKGTVAIVASSV